MKSYKKWKTAGVAITLIGVLAGCNTEGNGLPTAANVTSTATTTTNNSGSGNLNTPTTNASSKINDKNATNTITTSSAGANNSVKNSNSSSQPVIQFGFYIKFPPNTTLQLWGAGPEGNSAPLGTIKSGATGWVKSPYQHGWTYGIGSGNSQVVISNQSKGPQLSGIPNNTSYVIQGHPSNNGKSDTVISTGAVNGYIAIPHRPGWDISIQYKLQGVTHSVQIRIPA